MGQSIVDLLPTYMCFIAAAFLLGNTRFVRFSRQLIPAITACILCYRIYVHARADYIRTEEEAVSFYNILIAAIDVVLKKCSKRVGAFLGDILGLIMVSVALSALQDLAFLKFSVIKKQFFDEAYAIVRHIPMVKSVLVKEQTKIEEHFEKDLKEKSRAIGTRYPTDSNSPNSYSTLPVKVTFLPLQSLFVENCHSVVSTSVFVDFILTN